MQKIRIAKDRDQEQLNLKMAGIKISQKPLQLDGQKRKVLGDLNNQQIPSNVLKKDFRKPDINIKKEYDGKPLSSSTLIKPPKKVSIAKEVVTSEILIPRVERKPFTVKRSFLENILLKSNAAATISRKELPTTSTKSQSLAVQKVDNKDHGVHFFEKKSGYSFNEVINIDKRDKNVPTRVSEYINDIYSYLMTSENSYIIQENFLDNHPDITSCMRAMLVEWINEVHAEFNLTTEAYFLAISILDRYTQKIKNIPRRSYQLVGTTALFIAAKYEEIYPRKIAEFIYMTEDAYTVHQIITMEAEMLKSLDFRVNNPLPIHFMRRFIKAASVSKKEYVACKYFLELATVDYELASKKPSEIAATALFLVLYIYKPSISYDAIWTPTLEFYTTYKVRDLLPTVIKLAQVILSSVEDDESSMQKIVEKYSSSIYYSVSTSEEMSSEKIRKLAKI